jgi:hypothetical protein
MSATIEQKKGIPKHYSPVMPYSVLRDAKSFIEFITAVFGATEILRVNKKTAS